jgi:hypothetical protein
LRTVIFIFMAAVTAVLAGCEPTAEQKNRLDRPPLGVPMTERLTGEGLLSREKELLAAGKELLTIDFQQGQILRYKFTSSRDISLDWDPEKKQTKPGKNPIDKTTESMEMVVAYTPIEVNPFGLTTIKATCESVKARRSKGTQKDAVESLHGRTFTFTVGPTGIIDDYSQLSALIKEAGNKAFQSENRKQRIKEPDMIGDFAATQWFLWDSISHIEKATDGVSAGQSWKSKLSVPGPMVMKKARDVTYTLDRVQQSEIGRMAVIKSSYSPTESVSGNWPPFPYSGSFQMRGTFGFLNDYKILQLQGQGEEHFNVDVGRIEMSNQQYEAQLQASIPLGIEIKPRITIKQNFTMQLLK